jgi:DNA transformation protein
VPISDEYLDYVLDQLEDIGSISVRRMFGGAGLYLDGIFFAIIADDVLYFKVDDTNLPDYLEAGMAKFHTLRYYEVPVDVLEDRDKLRVWADRAVAVAIRKLSENKRKK